MQRLSLCSHPAGGRRLLPRGSLLPGGALRGCPQSWGARVCLSGFAGKIKQKLAPNMSVDVSSKQASSSSGLCPFCLTHRFCAAFWEENPVLVADCMQRMRSQEQLAYGRQGTASASVSKFKARARAAPSCVRDQSSVCVLGAFTGSSPGRQPG